MRENTDQKVQIAEVKEKLKKAQENNLKLFEEKEDLEKTIENLKTNIGQMEKN